MLKSILLSILCGTPSIKFQPDLYHENVVQTPVHTFSFRVAVVVVNIHCPYEPTCAMLIGNQSNCSGNVKVD